jgi:hypothetical protein
VNGRSVGTERAVVGLNRITIFVRGHRVLSAHARKISQLH